MGGGPEQPLIRAYADVQGVGEICTFTGRVSDDDLCRILSSADVAVDPDPKTAWSDQSTMNKIMEYMFFGLPIVCYELTEHKVSAQDAAVYVEADSERALAEGISALLDEPGVARAWRGRRRAGARRSSCGGARCRLCWQPTTQSSRVSRTLREPGGASGVSGHGLLARVSRQRWGPAQTPDRELASSRGKGRAHLPPTFARSPRATFRIVSAACEGGPGRFRGCRTTGFELNL